MINLHICAPAHQLIAINWFVIGGIITVSCISGFNDGQEEIGLKKYVCVFFSLLFYPFLYFKANDFE
jgi:hypothetical protein